MKEIHKKFGLVVASLLALVLLISFVYFAQGQPGAPTLVSPENNENINDNTPLIDWQNVPGADNYHIQIDNDSNYSSPNVDNDNVGGVSQYTVPNENALPDGVYYWHVQAENADGYGPWSENWIFRVDTLAPAAPIITQPSPNENISDNTPTIIWSAVNENSFPVLYRVWIDNDSSFTSPENDSGWINALNYTSGYLQDNLYYLRVAAKDNAGNQGDNSELTFRVDILAPAAPTITQPFPNENISDNTPTITWSAVSENSLPVLYRVWIDNDSSFSSPENDSGWINALTYTSGYLQDNMYYLRVGAKDNAGNVGDNSQLTFRVDTLAPAAPTLVSPDNGAQTADSTPTLSWNIVDDNSLPVTYDLQIDDASDFSSPSISQTGLTDNSYTTSSLADGTWCWRVRARDNAGNAGNWSWRLFKVDTTAQAAPTLTAPANDMSTNDSTPTFDWEPVSGAASYTLQYATDSGFTQNLTTISSTATDYTPTAALADDTWYWRMRTIDAVGNISGWSSTWSFTIDITRPTISISSALQALGATPTATGWTLTTSAPSIEVSGSISDATDVIVKINNKVVPIIGGSFSKTVDLMVGTNTFTIAITDAAGNTTTRTLSVMKQVAAPLPTAPSVQMPSTWLIIVAALMLAIVLIGIVWRYFFKRKAAKTVPVPRESPILTETH